MAGWTSWATGIPGDQRARYTEGMHAPELIAAAKVLDLDLPSLAQEPEGAQAAWKAWQDGALKAAWKAAARQHHPDTGGDPSQFRAAKDAYELLRDAEVRFDDPEDPAQGNAFLREALRRTVAQVERLQALDRKRRADEARRRAEAKAREAQTLASLRAAEAQLQARAAEIRAQQARLEEIRQDLARKAAELAQTGQLHRELRALRTEIEGQRTETARRPRAPRPPNPPDYPRTSPEDLSGLLTTALDVSAALGLDRALGLERPARSLRRALRQE